MRDRIVIACAALLLCSCTPAGGEDSPSDGGPSGRTADAGTAATNPDAGARTPGLDAGAIAAGSSCQALSPTCGPAQDQSCCATRAVPGGQFDRLANASFPATLSPFALDAYEVTVGRFRAFVESGGGTRARPPAAGAGAHPRIPGSGWDPAWNASLVVDGATLDLALRCSGKDTDGDGDIDQPSGFNAWGGGGMMGGSPDSRPMNCVTWFEAFAFCAWDGGRLPTEWEWNFAALGGAEGRAYPWSSPPSSTGIDWTRASYNCEGDGSGPGVCGLDDLVLAGSNSPAGDGRWGHAELAGNLWEWALDWHTTMPVAGPCADCANLTPGTAKVILGGGWTSSPAYLSTAYSADGFPPGGRRSSAPGCREPTCRDGQGPLAADRAVDIGFRCAR